MSDSLWPHGLQHTMLPCPSLSPGVCSNSCPFSWWCHPTISSSVAPFSLCPQSFPASGSFPVSQLLASGDQNIGASASTSVLPINIRDWLPLRLTWSPYCPRDSQESSPAPQFKSISSSAFSLLVELRITWNYLVHLLVCITNSRNMNLSKLREIVKDREAWHAAFHGLTESNTTERLNNNFVFPPL